MILFVGVLLRLKQPADGGIDGRLYFTLPSERDLQSMAIEVKGGKNVNIRDLRALCGVLDNDEALICGINCNGTIERGKVEEFS